MSATFDPDSLDLSYSYVWFINGAERKEYANRTKLGALSLSFADSVQVGVTPFDGLDSGNLILSNVIFINDTEPLSVSIQQLDGRRFVDKMTSINITFNRILKESTVNETNIYLIDNDNNRLINCRLSYQRSNAMVVMIPDEEFIPYHNYSLAVDDIFDMLDNPIPLGAKWEFGILIPKSESIKLTGPIIGGNFSYVEISQNVIPRNSFPVLSSPEDTEEIHTANSKLLASLDYTIIPPSIMQPFIEVKFFDGNGNIINILKGNIRISIPVLDANADGYVDGTRIRKDYLKMFYLDRDEQAWKMVDNSGVSSDNQNYITGTVDHLSVFAVMAYLKVPDEGGRFINYPNPFEAGEKTRIKLYLNLDGLVDINIYTLTGELVKTFNFFGKYQYNEIEWDGSNDQGLYVESGVYFCRVNITYENNIIETKTVKIAVLK